MPSPKVYIKEVDQTQIIPSQPGAAGGIVIPAKRGPVDTPVLVDSQSQFLSRFSATGKVEVGDDTSYFSALTFLSYSDKLYVVRRIGDGAITSSLILSSSHSAFAFDTAYKRGQIVVQNSQLFLVVVGGTASSGATPTWTNSQSAELEVQGTSSAPLDNEVFFSRSTLVFKNLGFYITEPYTATSGYEAYNFGYSAPYRSNDTSYQKGDVVHHGNLFYTATNTGTTGNGISGGAATFKAGTNLTLELENVTQSGSPTRDATITGLNLNSSGVSTNTTAVLTFQGGGVWIVTRLELSSSGNFTADISLQASVGVTSSTGGNVIAADQSKVLDLQSIFPSPTSISTYEREIGKTITDGGVTWNIEGQYSHILKSDPSASVIIGAADVGTWGNSLSVSLINNDSSPTEVRTENAFLLTVNRGINELEASVGSVVPGSVDGFGRNIFVDETFANSYNISAKTKKVSPIVTAIEDYEPAGPRNLPSFTRLRGGNDGADTTQTDIANGYRIFENTNNVSIEILLDGGQSNKSVAQEIERVCRSRADCLGILSTPLLTSSGGSPEEQLKNYRVGSTDGINIDSSYVALFGPRVIVSDRFANRRITIAPDGYIAGIIARNSVENSIWVAPAGLKESTRLPVLDVEYRFNESDADNLYDNGVNLIRFFPQRGIAPFGQKTLQKAASSRDRINVRLLLNYIKPPVKNLLQQFLFRENTVDVRDTITFGIVSFLDEIKNAAVPGISSFKVVANSTNNSAGDIQANRLNVWIYITPVYTIEEIRLRVVLTSDNVLLEEG